MTQLPGFAEGEVSVQDAAAQRAAPLLLGAGPAGRARACSTPAPHRAARPRTCSNSPICDLLALDSDPPRLLRVQDTLNRLQPARPR